MKNLWDLKKELNTLGIDCIVDNDYTIKCFKKDIKVVWEKLQDSGLSAQLKKID